MEQGHPSVVGYMVCGKAMGTPSPSPSSAGVHCHAADLLAEGVLLFGARMDTGETRWLMSLGSRGYEPRRLKQAVCSG